MNRAVNVLHNLADENACLLCMYTFFILCSFCIILGLENTEGLNLPFYNCCRIDNIIARLLHITGYKLLALNESNDDEYITYIHTYMITLKTQTYRLKLRRIKRTHIRICDANYDRFSISITLSLL